MVLPSTVNSGPRLGSLRSTLRDGTAPPVNAEDMGRAASKLSQQRSCCLCLRRALLRLRRRLEVPMGEGQGAAHCCISFASKVVLGKL